MRSLKIIIFRDTDKPYTMIISSRVIIGLTFGLVALIWLLGFSVMGNFMLWNAGVLAEALPTQTMNEAGVSVEPLQDDSQQGGQQEEATEEDSGQDSAQGIAEESTESGFEGSEDNSEELPGSFAEMIDNPYMIPGGSAHDIVLLGEPLVLNNSVQVRLEVRKRTELGIRAGGRLITALVDVDGNVGSSLPRSIVYEGMQITNPERGTRFIIARRNTYNLEFQSVDTLRFNYLALFIYDEQGTLLQWRNIIPLRR